MKRTYAPLLALLVVVAACGTVEPAATTTGPAPVTTAAPAPTTTAVDPPGGDSITSVDGIVVGEPLVLSATHYVVEVESDDVLNGRYGPGVEYSVNAELDPAYGTVRAKGSTRELESGSVWASVAYSPDTQLVEDPTPYGYGWVNSHFIAPIDGWVPSGGDCDLAGPAGGSFGDGASTANEVYDVIAVDLGDCIRIVVTFAESTGGAHLGATVPVLSAVEIDGSRLRIELPADSVLPHATDILSGDVGAVVAMKPGGGFWLDIAQPGAAAVRSIEGSGQIVIDIEKGDVGSIFHHDGSIVALPPSGPTDQLGFVGYARPFESTLGIIVGEWQGDSEYPEYVHGSSVIPGGRAVMTSGWLDSWGIYEFTVEDLPSGTYNIVLADNTAVETGFSVVRFKVTVP